MNFKNNFRLVFLFFTSISIYFNASSQSDLGRVYTGKASYYAQKFYGRKTASGEVLNHQNLTIAHRTLPFGTMVEIENLSNHKWVVARVNDRGPFTAGVLIDITDAVKSKLGVKGNVNVSVMIVGDAGTIYLGRNDVTQNTSEIIKGIEDNQIVADAEAPMKVQKTKKGYSKNRRTKKRR